MRTSKNLGTARPKGKGAIVELEPEEWCFKTLPKAEIEACYLYEYGREFARGDPEILKLLSELQIKMAEKKRGWVGLLQTLSQRFEIVFTDFPMLAFMFIPGIPWQGLSKSDRSNIVTEVREGYSRRQQKSPSRRLHIETLGQLEPANIASLRTFKFYHEIFYKDDLGETEYGFFALNWKHTDKDIRDAFNAWLSEQRTERNSLGIAKAKHKSRGGFSDRLNWLGALRIVNHYPAQRLADYTDSNLKIEAPYSHLPDLYANAKKARKLVAALFGD
jgi:hypothetical protein